MAGEYFVEDGHILWMARQLVGTPPAWAQGVDYPLGAVVVPTNPQPGQEALMFQVVGFLGKSGPTQPTWTTNIGDSILDFEVEWSCHDPLSDPDALAYNEYHLITETVSVT